MANTLSDFMQKYDNVKHATKAGTTMHKKMRFVDMHNINDDIVKQIKKRPDLAMFFDSDALTEVPVAADINGRFISRRIDRMIVDNERRVVRILDYKTDINKDSFRAEYIAQVREYMAIVGKIYPEYKIFGYILWLHDWVLEKV